MPKSEYLSLFEKCNVFIAPRKKEGIGITIVEAISKGMFVVGYNDSTMNEYVSDKKVGFIFDEKKTEKINTKDIIENRWSMVENDFKMWGFKISPVLNAHFHTFSWENFELFRTKNIKYIFSLWIFHIVPSICHTFSAAPDLHRGSVRVAVRPSQCECPSSSVRHWR